MGFMKLDLDDLERVASFFKAFSEPTRLALLQELKEGPRTVNQLTAALPCTQANISKQLKTLHEAGLVDRRREATRVHYSICEPAVLDLCAIACDKLNRSAKPRKLRF